MTLGARWDIGDPAVDAFVDVNLISFAAWDLVTYAYRNPDTHESVERLASVLARQEVDLRPAVERLAANGVLVEVAGDPPRFGLTEDAELRRIVGRFLEMATRREHRLEFVRRVLAKVTGG